MLTVIGLAEPESRKHISSGMAVPGEVAVPKMVVCNEWHFHPMTGAFLLSSSLQTI